MGCEFVTVDRVLRLLFARYSWSQKSFCIDDSTVFKKENNASVCLSEWVAQWGKRLFSSSSSF